MGKRGRFLEQSDLSHPLDMKGNTGLFSETTCTQSNRDAQGPDLQLVSRLGSCMSTAILTELSYSHTSLSQRLPAEIQSHMDTALLPLCAAQNGS